MVLNHSLSIHSGRSLQPFHNPYHLEEGAFTMEDGQPLASTPKASPKKKIAGTGGDVENGWSSWRWIWSCSRCGGVCRLEIILCSPVQDIVSAYDMKEGTLINLRAAVLDLMDIKQVKVRARGSSQVDKDV